MKYIPTLSPTDEALSRQLQAFVPKEIFDIHVHPYNAEHFPSGEWKFLDGIRTLGCAEHRRDLQRYMPAVTVHGLYFGMPSVNANLPAMNAWVADEAQRNGTRLSRALMVVRPQDNPADIATAMRSGQFSGIKVYHCYAARPDTMNASVEEFAPEWMWEILNEMRGVLMLHIVRDGAIDDPGNQRAIRRLCRAYPRMRLVLAHVARSFNYRNARSGLHTLADLDNAMVDTSAVCEAESFQAALEFLGPKRVLWGSDYAVSEMRGRCVTTGQQFFWLHPEVLQDSHRPSTTTDMTLVGIESLVCLREACEDGGLTQGDIGDIFLGNALRVLEPHLPAAAAPSAQNGQALWLRAREVISMGTGLMSKRAEGYDPKSWPSYFSRCSGSEVWDLSGRRYVDFAGGIGAVVLGYHDPEVTAAVRRRLALGTYCSLVSPQEVELAEQLLSLHPWAGKVRYARGGGEAMAMSVRIARAATGRSGVAFCGYHGWHDWYLAANLGETDALNGHLIPGLEPKGVPRELRGTATPFRYNDFASFEAALAKLGDNLAAVVMEPMRSQFPAHNFVREVATRARKAGAVFVVDEVTSGLRYGLPGAMSRLGVEPDLAVYAKAYGNGFPFGAVVGRDAVMESADGSFISSSYWTDGVGPAAALAVLEKVQRLHVPEIIWSRGTLILGAFQALGTKYPRCKLAVGIIPALPTLSFDLGADAPLAQVLYVRKMQERGFLVSENYYLMLAHDEEKISRLLAAAAESVGEIDAIVAQGDLAKVAGVPAKTRKFARLA